MDNDTQCSCQRTQRRPWIGCQSDAPQVLAMAYVPKQVWGEVYDADVGLCRGTIFPALDKPLEVIR